MTVRVRFAPSPTGSLHVGGARTALYNYLWARHNIGGKFILRIEDTDQERSKKTYEEQQIEDLKWLKMEFDEGPYRQSERFDLYKEKALELIEKGKAYYCFCSDEELAIKKEKAQLQNLSPHYDQTCKILSSEEVFSRLQNNEKAVIRFSNPSKICTFNDQVRGEVSFPGDMIGDFIILRSDQSPVYNFCCAIDDWSMEISHVIRAEEHLPNTLRQLLIMEAFGAVPPKYAHLSLIVGEDRQKLSKRHGATSVSYYRQEGFLAEALINYLVLLGWSHPQEKDIFDFSELISKFDIHRFGKAPAVFDPVKFKWINGQHLRGLSNENLLSEITPFISKDSPFHQRPIEYKLKVIELFKVKLEHYKELNSYLAILFSDQIETSDEMKNIFSNEGSLEILEFLESQFVKINKDAFLSKETIQNWVKYFKKDLKIKGKALFLQIRGLLTGRSQGPDLMGLITLTPVAVLKSKLNKIKKKFFI